MIARPHRILPIIVLSQLCGTSLWFAGNAVLPDLQSRLGLPDRALGDMTSAVQLGFIAGTLVFALLAISDRYSPRTTFLACALLGAACNAIPYFAGGHTRGEEGPFEWAAGPPPEGVVGEVVCCRCYDKSSGV